jgi:hypothetical protein
MVQSKVEVPGERLKGEIQGGKDDWSKEIQGSKDDWSTEN